MILFFIVTGLLIINILFVSFSDRKRRYGIYSSRIFQILFLSYCIYFFILLEYSDTKKIVPPSFSAVKKPKKVVPKTNDIVFENKMEKKHNLKIHVNILSYLIKSILIQACIVVLFSIIGLLTINNRNKYYWTILIAHVLLFGFCLFFNWAGSIALASAIR